MYDIYNPNRDFEGKTIVASSYYGDREGYVGHDLWALLLLCPEAPFIEYVLIDIDADDEVVERDCGDNLYTVLDGRLSVFGG